MLLINSIDDTPCVQLLNSTPLQIRQHGLTTGAHLPMGTKQIGIQFIQVVATLGLRKTWYIFSEFGINIHMLRDWTSSSFHFLYTDPAGL
jgi:hypothetical protein